MSVKTAPYDWDMRIKEYLDSDWSNRPSPFAMLSRSYFPKNAQILELGAGAGQDGVWFAKQGYDTVITDQSEAAFDEIKRRVGTAPVKVEVVNMAEKLPFPDDSFDVVYSQLGLHYFNNETTHAIFEEIVRVLKPRGIVALMVNSTKDPEFDASKVDSEGLLNLKGLTKRYFTTESLAPFVASFQKILSDEQGRTPKDDAKQTSGMIRFIGRRR